MYSHTQHCDKPVLLVCGRSHVSGELSERRRGTLLSTCIRNILEDAAEATRTQVSAMWKRNDRLLSQHNVVLQRSFGVRDRPVLSFETTASAILRRVTDEQPGRQQEQYVLRSDHCHMSGFLRLEHAHGSPWRHEDTEVGDMKLLVVAARPD